MSHAREGAPAYLSNSPADIEAMLEAIGAGTFERLVATVPAHLRRRAAVELPAGLSEMEVMDQMTHWAARNHTYRAVMAGGGAYDHYSPALVRHILQRPEFYTAYTPYQAEISQGTLQAMYEFQTAVGLLTGMEVANASMYDGASALAEGVRMALHITRRRRVLVADTLHPHYRSVIETYLQGIDVELVSIPERHGRLDIERLETQINDATAAVVVQYPNFFGQIEPLDTVRRIVRTVPNVQLVVSFYPTAAGLLRSPGEFDADIVTGEGQALGLPLNFGGPYLGLFATRQKYIRRMPGRLAGRTVDAEGNPGYVLTLQTREQHIKRDRATSNICTNQGLMALAALVYLTWLGKEGLKAVARHSYAHAHYLADGIARLRGYQIRYTGPFFNEFVFTGPHSPDRILDALKAEGILGGVDLRRWNGEGILVAATEKHRKAVLDRYIDVLKKL